MTRFLKIFLGIMIVLLSIYIVFSIIINNFVKTPLEKFKGTQIGNFEELKNAQVMVENYINIFVNHYYNNLDILLDKNIKKDISTYNAITDSISTGKVFITDVLKDTSNNYLIKYTIENNTQEEMLVKVNENNMTYIIYYDSLLEKY